MSQRHLVSHGAGSNMDSPTVNIKNSSLGESCSSSFFQDTDHHDFSEFCSFDNKDFIGKKENDSTLIQEHLETSSLGLTNPLESPTPRKKFVFPGKESDKSPELCETPKIRRIKCLPRRRLDLSFSLLKGGFKSQSSYPSSGVRSPPVSLEKFTSSIASNVSSQSNFSPFVTSTIKTEELTSSSQNLRLNFSQHKTSTIDDSKDDCSLFEVECISPIQCTNSKDSVPHDFSGSSLSIDADSSDLELLGSCGRTSHGAYENIFVTPVSNLVANIKFSVGETLSLSSEARSSVSTPDDSGFSSLSWDKSEDSLSEQESSFQELLQKHKGTPRVGDTIKKSRHLGRSRRLSTLQEQSSQSETEEEKQIIHSSSESRFQAASDISESLLSSDQGKDLAWSLKDLSHTPALQLVRELFMKGRRKRFQKKDEHGFSEERDEGKIAILQCVLAGLIGKKMGIQQLDILTELKYRNLKHILAMILDALSAESLYSAWKVSRNWREIVAQDKKANRRRKFYIAQLKARSEGAVLNVHDAATRLHLVNRSALRSVQAQAPVPSSQKEQDPVLSPWGEVLTPEASSSSAHLSSKQEQYVKVARTLFNDEALKPCPRCQSPAKYQPYKKRGLCCHPACGFDFCVLCLCAYHGSEECRRGSTKTRNSKDALPGSAQSKRNLKRL